MPDEDSTTGPELTLTGATGVGGHDSSSSAAAPGGRTPLEFPPTRWTLVLEAAESDDEKARQAISDLCEHYRGAIQGYFRRKCRDPQAAEDLAGAFVLHLLERNRFRNFEKRENMRFRNYLSRALKYFLYDHLPEKPAEPIEPYLETAGQEVSLEKHLDAHVALAVHQRALGALRESYGRHGKAARMERLRPFLFEEPAGDEYPRAAAELGLTMNALHQAVYRLRHDYYERFCAEVAQTVRACQAEVDDETRYLMALVPAALGDENRSA